MSVLKLGNISEAELQNAFPEGSKDSSVLRRLPHQPLPSPTAQVPKQLRRCNLVLPSENRTTPNTSVHKRTHFNLPKWKSWDLLFNLSFHYGNFQTRSTVEQQQKLSCAHRPRSGSPGTIYVLQKCSSETEKGESPLHGTRGRH